MLSLFRMAEMNSLSETDVMKLEDIFKRASVSIQMDIVIRRRACSFFVYTEYVSPHVLVLCFGRSGKEHVQNGVDSLSNRETR